MHLHIQCVEPRDSGQNDEVSVRLVAQSRILACIGANWTRQPMVIEHDE